MDDDDENISLDDSRAARPIIQVGNDEPNQLDRKQDHPRFDEDEDHRPKLTFTSGAQNSLIGRRIDISEHLKDPEHNQAHNERVHGHGQGNTSQAQYITPGSTVK